MRGRPRIISLQKVGVPHHFPNWRSLCVGVGVDGVEPSRAVSFVTLNTLLVNLGRSSQCKN